MNVGQKTGKIYRLTEKIIAKSPIKHWSLVKPMFKGWIGKSSALIPIFGYLVLLSDSSVSLFSLETAIPPEKNVLFLSSILRMKIIYLGLVTLFFGVLLFNKYCPSIISNYSDRKDFIEHNLRVYGHDDYRNNSEVVLKKFSVKMNKKEIEMIEYPNSNFFYSGDFVDENKVNFLRTSYYFYNKSNRTALQIVLLIGLAGYILLAIPSIDVFQAVIRTL